MLLVDDDDNDAELSWPTTIRVTTILRIVLNVWEEFMIFRVYKFKVTITLTYTQTHTYTYIHVIDNSYHHY